MSHENAVSEISQGKPGIVAHSYPGGINRRIVTQATQAKTRDPILKK
jgi:hypothetical protein